MTVSTKENKPQQVTSKKKLDKNQEPTMLSTTIEYLKGVRSEWHKVTWPDRPQIIQETIVVLAVTAFTTILILCIDWILHYVISLIPGSR